MFCLVLKGFLKWWNWILTFFVLTAVVNTGILEGKLANTLRKTSTIKTSWTLFSVSKLKENAQRVQYLSAHCVINIRLGVGYRGKKSQIVEIIFHLVPHSIWNNYRKEKFKNTDVKKVVPFSVSLNFAKNAYFPKVEKYRDMMSINVEKYRDIMPINVEKCREIMSINV